MIQNICPDMIFHKMHWCRFTVVEVILLATVISAQTYETSWLAFLVPLSVAILLLWLPGLFIGFVGGLRRSELFAWAPAGSVAAIACAGVVVPALNMSWGLTPIIFLTLVFVIVSWLFRQMLLRTVNISTKVEHFQRQWKLKNFYQDFRQASVAIVVLLTTFVLAGIRFATIVETPGAFAQTWDNLFHLNVIQGIVDGGSPSSLSISSNPLGAAGFYPAAWHNYASVIVLLTGAPPATAEIAAGIVVAYLAWPLGVYALSKVVTGKRLIALIAVPSAVAFPQFPSNFLSYGTLYPNMLGVCLLPVLIAFVVRGLKLWDFHTWKYVYFVVIGAIAVALAQPNALIGFALIVIATFYGAHVRYAAASMKHHRILKCTGVSALWLFILLIFNFGLDRVGRIHSMRTGYEYWHPQGEVWQAILQLLSASGGRQQGNLELVSISLMAPLGILILLGLYMLVVHGKELWIASNYVGLSALFIMSFSLSGALRVYTVGIWYSEVPRVWALLMPFLPMLAAAGIYFLLRKIFSLCAQEKRRFVAKDVQEAPTKTNADERNMRSIGIVVSCAVLSVLGLFAPHTKGFIADSKNVYQISQTSFVDTDEYALFNWMRDHVSEGEYVVANPWEGGSFSWGIGGVPSVYSTMNMPGNEDLIYLAQHFNAAQADSKVCQIVEEYGVKYALDFENTYLWGGSGWDTEKQYSGLDDTANSAIGKVVKQFGDAKLVEVTVCAK